MLRNAVGGGGVSFPGKKRYERVRFNVISVTRGWVGVKFPGKKRYVTLEWPLTRLGPYCIKLGSRPFWKYENRQTVMVRIRHNCRRVVRGR